MKARHHDPGAFAARRCRNREARAAACFRAICAVALIAATTFVAGGCIEFSAFESDLDEDECDQNARNLERLAALPPPSGALRFAVFGDSHQALDELSDVVDAVNARDVAFVLHLGDMTDSGLRNEYRWTLEQLKRLRRPFLTAIGNHDALSNGKDVYRRMFGPYDYQFTHGSVRLVVVNTNELEFEGHAPDLDWLSKAVVPQSDVGVTLVAAHQRPQDPGYDETLAESGIDAVLSAHVHRSEQSAIADIPAFATGPVKAREWAMVTIEDGAVKIDDCVSDTCASSVP